MDIGSELRAAREAHGLSLEALAQRTRVQPRLLAAIEHNDVHTLPPKPYGRGFVRAYASEVGCDPDSTVREYFAQFAAVVTEPTAPAPPPERWFAPAWTWLGGIALGVLVLVLWSVGSTSTREPSSDETVGTSGTNGPVATALAAEAPAPIPAERAVPAGQPMTVVLAAMRDCWVTATADGERAVFRLLRAGDRETLRADREIVIRAGDAGALSLTLNGRDAGPAGGPGEVRTLRITPAGTEIVR